MSIKNLLKWLIDSRTTVTEASRSSMPSNSSQEVTVMQSETSDSDLLTTTVAEYVAPTDGYIVATAQTVDTHSRLLILSSAKQYMFSATPNSTTIGGTIPMSKGYNCTIQGLNVTNIRVLFYKTMGALTASGGGKIFNEACVCLKAFLNCSLKPSSRAKNPGFRARRLFRIKGLSLCLGNPLQTLSELNLQHRRMGCFNASFAQKFPTKFGLLADRTTTELLERLRKPVKIIGLNSSTGWKKDVLTQSLLQEAYRQMIRLRLSRSTSTCGDELCWKN